MHVVKYGQPIFDGNPKARADFEAKTMLEYADFRPLLDMIDRNILASL